MAVKIGAVDLIQSDTLSPLFGIFPLPLDTLGISALVYTLESQLWVLNFDELQCFLSG